MKLLTLAALVNCLLWIQNITWSNALTLFLQSLVGTILFIALAVYVNTIDAEMKNELGKIHEELNQLKKT